MSTPYKKRAPDSPSRQLLWELNQLAISSQENFYANLDRANEEQEESHKQALAVAARKHELVRQDAEIERQRLQEEQEAQQRRREEEHRNVLEHQRRQNELAEQRNKSEQIRLAEEHRKELAKLQKEKKDMEEQQEAERKKHAISQKLQEEREIEKKRQEDARAIEENVKKDATAAEKKAKEAEANAKEAAKAAMRAKEQSTLSSETPASQPIKTQQWELEHDRYLQIHQRLKDLRKFMIKTAKERPELKDGLGSMRRDIKKSVGQLIETKGANKKPLSNIIETLRKSLKIPEPTVNVTNFLAHPPVDASSDPTGPALMVYLLNEFSKSVVAQWIDEAGVSPKRADAIGIVASHIFALDFFRWKGISLIDILIAKMHVVAPALFGIYGPESTVQGKERIGWWRQEGRSEGAFIPDQLHFVRMTGLGAGYAALSLRNYEKAKVENPYPEHHYWEALAKISNVPTHAITQTHFVLLKGMIQNYETKFIGFYGGAAVAALKEAVVELPARCPPSVANKSLAGLKDVLGRETKLFL